MHIYMHYAICTLYIAHTAHLFLHTFCIYNKVYNQSINDYLYNGYAQYRVHKLYAVLEVCSVFAIRYKYIVEVLEKTIRSTGLIDHSFERKFYGACYGPR